MLGEGWILERGDKGYTSVKISGLGVVVVWIRKVEGEEKNCW